MHLAERPYWIAEILERGAAYDEIERIGLKRQRRGVTVTEVGLDTGAPPGRRWWKPSVNQL
jgi:hypothetical protein